jgi:hypothetical protein
MPGTPKVAQALPSAGPPDELSVGREHTAQLRSDTTLENWAIHDFHSFKRSWESAAATPWSATLPVIKTRR